MENRRQLMAIVMTMAFALLWFQLVPRLFPDFFPKPQKPGANQVVDNPEGDGENPLANEDNLDKAQQGDDPQPDKNAVVEGQDPEPPAELKEFSSESIVLGETGFDDGFLIQAQINSKGAAIDWVLLTDPRYTDLERQEQLKVVGNDFVRNVGEGPVPKTFQTSILQFDEQLKQHGTNLAEVDWELIQQSPTSVEFRYPSPDGRLEAVKTYTITQANPETVDEDNTGYMMDVDFVIRNLSDETIETTYTLQGPVGLPLENVDNTRLFREIKVGTLENDRDPTDVSALKLTAANLVKQVDKAQKSDKPVDAWREEIQYAGVDVQFFAALVHPVKQLENNYFEATKPELIYKADKPDHSDISLTMQSQKLSLAAGKDVTHQFQVFFGPKRTKLLDDLYASEVVALGWFAPISKAMLWVLGFFHSTVGLPYAFAIILLTVVVRGMMFPISKKQAIEGEKMKVLAPKLKEIQEKHKDKPEEFAKAYREFQKKHDYHPMVGCLPALLQLPIFYGLYSCLFQAVDLRLARFLWIDNLAAPDAMFNLGFTVPYFGWTTFNLLPLLTVALFIAQQKLFTPPPTSPDQEATYKMMNFMMIAIGFMFYRVPAGLCLYFIASSLWGICERLLLKKNAVTVPNSDGPIEIPDKVTKEAPQEPKKPGFFDKLIAAADQAKANAESQQKERQFGKKHQKKKKKK